MKKTLTLIAALLLTAVTGFAQTVNVHKADGTIVSYPATEVDYVDFTAAPNDNPEAPAGVEAVDLGLPSGTKWANMNIGATKPEETGDYFRWAETTPFKEGDTEATYPYRGGVDLGESIAGTQYDAATANWGTPWKMPTIGHILELKEHCTWTWTSLNGVEGAKVTGPNGNSIFLPASGYRDGYNGSLYDVGSHGHYWSASAESVDSYTLFFGSDYWNWGDRYRANGLPVRAVVEAAPTAKVEAVEAIDLGLPSGTKWANMNIGATKPEESGDYFRWAETTPFKEGDTVGTYPYSYVDLGESIAGTQYDAATANWGAPWKMPTKEQIQELIDNCTYIWTLLNGVSGVKVKGPNGNSIFLPASGYRDDGSGTLYSVGHHGYYWSASANGSSTYNALNLEFRSDHLYWYRLFRADGLPVRAVAE